MIVSEPIADRCVTNPPSLILEILSLSTVLKDRNTKCNLYKAYGERNYLIADTGKKRMEILQLKDNTYQEMKDLKSFNLTTDCTLELSLNDLFN